MSFIRQHAKYSLFTLALLASPFLSYGINFSDINAASVNNASPQPCEEGYVCIAPGQSDGAFETLRITNDTEKAITLDGLQRTKSNPTGYFVGYYDQQTGRQDTTSSWLALVPPESPSEDNCITLLKEKIMMGPKISCTFLMKAKKQAAPSTKTTEIFVRYRPEGDILDKTLHIDVVSGTYLYAGGNFTETGDGTTVSHMARGAVDMNDDENKNNFIWTSLGGGVNEPVNALITDSLGNLYAGGDFTTAGGKAANHIAKWDGSHWNPLGKGVGGGSVKTLALGPVTTPRYLYVGGDFTTAGGKIAQGIAKWSRVPRTGMPSWSAMGSGVVGSVNALLLDGKKLYAGGSFSLFPGGTQLVTAEWNDNTDAWDPMWTTNNSIGLGQVDALIKLPNRLSSTSASPYDGAPLAAGLFSMHQTFYPGFYKNINFAIWGYMAPAWAGKQWYSGLGPVNSAIQVRTLKIVPKDKGYYIYYAGQPTSSESSEVRGMRYAYVSKLLPRPHMALEMQDQTQFGSMDGSIFALLTNGPYLRYAGGKFTHNGKGATLNNIAQWKKTAAPFGDGVWSPLGSGLNGEVNAMAVGTAIDVIPNF